MLTMGADVAYQITVEFLLAVFTLILPYIKINLAFFDLHVIPSQHLKHIKNFMLQYTIRTKKALGFIVNPKTLVFTGAPGRI
jgi:hypothetical protein